MINNEPDLKYDRESLEREVNNLKRRLDTYGDSPELSEQLLALIRGGRKRAGTALLWSLEAEGEPLPSVGDIEVVLDHRHEPSIISRITWVEVLPFGEVSAEYAAVEGEGDGSLDHWRRVHWDFFTRECRGLGREADWEMPVVCSVFEVVAVL